VANEVEAFNVRMCEQMGWSQYLTGEGGGDYPPPKTIALSQQSQKSVAAVAGAAKKIWSGIRTLNDWIDSGEPAVPKEEAERRAAICVACPLNGEGGLEKIFTAPASEAIRRQFEKLESRKLSTSHDAKLNICMACHCPMRLKVWTPFHFIKEQLSEATLNDLKKGRNCWIVEGL